MRVPPPLTTENGAVRVPTVPVNAAVEVISFVMVTISSENDPTLTFPKSTDAGVTDILMVGATPDTFTCPTMPMEQWGTQK